MGNIIEDELMSSSVIKDLKPLDFDYVPEELLHREEQLRFLAQMFKPMLSRITQNAIIRGPVGTGKTVIAKKFCNSIKNLARKQGYIIEYVHINCRKRSKDAMALLGILNHFDSRFPDRGFSVQEMLEVLRKQLKKREAHLLVVLDEVDALVKKSKSDLIYNLTRFSDESYKEKVPISLLLISQKDIIPMLDSSSISTFKRSNVLLLDKYTREELYNIVRQRIDLAFHNNIVNDDSIDLIADIASEWGDARFAIELLWKAGIAADHQHLQIVTPEHVRAAKAETFSVITETKLKNLERHQLITLYSIAKRLKKDGTAYVSTGEAEKTYAITCEEYNEKPRTHTMFWNYLKEIESAGFITIKLSGKGHLGTTQLISLPDIPAEVASDKVKDLLD
ncbi:MAG: orc1/cdc6 family replication initiation protein [Thermoplasmatales archaeon SG8-52-3]|nr:MAG: orc1/cdc6 family replication initiation protein [Thermoplasmatales archaeon SG8-52-3]